MNGPGTDQLVDVLTATPGQPWLRVGTVTGVADLASTPQRILVDAVPMRFLASYMSPTVGDVVLWIDGDAGAQVVVGELA